MRTFGYARVSTAGQYEDRQVIALVERGIPPENIFIDKQSGKNADRPQLQTLTEIVKPGDTIVVEAISRFARNARDLLNLVGQLEDKGVEFISLKENIDTGTPTGKFMLTVFGAVAELEREFILERQKEGIAAARLRGVKFGRPPMALPEDFGSLVASWERKEITIDEVLAKTGLAATTFFNRLRKYRGVKPA